MPVVADVPSIMKTHSLKFGSDLHAQVGLVSNAILLADVCKKTLLKFSIDKNHTQKKFEVDLPENVEADCSKFIFEDGRIILRASSGDGPTYIFDSTPELIRTQKGHFGYLRSILSSKDIAYVKRISWVGALKSPLKLFKDDSDHHIHIRSTLDHQLSLKLAPKESKRWSEFVSICRHPEIGYIAVVESISGLLDIFDDKGKTSFNQVYQKMQHGFYTV